MTVLAAAGVAAARFSALLMPGIAFYSPGLAASSFFALGILFALVALWTKRAAAVPDGPLPMLFAALVLLGLASVLWSVAPSKTLGTTINLTLLLAPMAFLFSEPGRTTLAAAGLLPWAAAGFALALFLVGFEAVSGNAIVAVVDPESWRPLLREITDFNRGFALLALIAWPVAGWFWLGRRRWAAGAVLAAAAAACLAGNAMAVKTGIAAGIAVFLAAAAVRHQALRLAWGLIAIYCLVVPIAVGTLYDLRDQLPETVAEEARGRLEFWDHLDRLAWERPFFGWGLAGSGRMPPVGDRDGYGAGFVGKVPAYAHNLPLEARIDLGIPGLLLIAGILAAAARGICGLGPKLRPFAVGCLGTGLWISCLSFQAWSDSTLFLYAAPALLFRLACTDPPPRPRS